MSEDIAEVEELTVPAALEGERVDRALSTLFGCSRTEASILIADGAVQLDGRVISSKSVRLHCDQVLSVTESQRFVEEPLTPSLDVALDIVYADADIVVINKAAGQIVHPGAGVTTGTLVSGLIARFDLVGDVGPSHRPGVVHRLDKGTSGLMVFALTGEAHSALSDLMRRHAVEREYLAVVEGIIDHDRGRIEAPIGRSQREPKKMEVRQGGRDASTTYQVLERFASRLPASYLRVKLETGRTHQIRVHLGHLGHPVVGDTVYGSSLDLIDRPALHSGVLEFIHPRTQEPMRFEADLPTDIVEVITLLRG